MNRSMVLLAMVLVVLAVPARVLAIEIALAPTEKTVAHDTLSDFQGFEIAGLRGISFDTGWRGAKVLGYSLHARTSGGFAGTYLDVSDVKGCANLVYQHPMGDGALSFDGGTGAVGFDYGADFGARWRAKGPLFGTQEGDLPFLPNFDFRIKDEKNFAEPYAIGERITLQDGTDSVPIVWRGFSITKKKKKQQKDKYELATAIVSINLSASSTAVFEGKGVRCSDGTYTSTPLPVQLSGNSKTVSGVTMLYDLENEITLRPSLNIALEVFWVVGFEHEIAAFPIPIKLPEQVNMKTNVSGPKAISLAIPYPSDEHPFEGWFVDDTHNTIPAPATPA